MLSGGPAIRPAHVSDHAMQQTVEQPGSCFRRSDSCESVFTNQRKGAGGVRENSLQLCRLPVWLPGAERMESHR
jgi:hypothetical protein